MTGEERKAKTRERNRRYYRTHRHELIQKARKYYTENIEESRKHSREYRKAHPEQYRKYQREYMRRKKLKELGLPVLLPEPEPNVRPEGCVYPDCFHCLLPDCMAEGECDLR